MSKSKLKFSSNHDNDGILAGEFSFDSPIVEEFIDFLNDIGSDLEGMGNISVFASPESREQLMNFCGSITLKEPDYLDAYAHAAGALYEGGEIAAAKIWYERGLKQAYSVIPHKFVGTISWMDIDNRPFLRLHHGLILCLCYRGEIKEAIKEAEQHLKWNPNDNIGVRFMLADLYTHENNIKKARDLMKESHDMTTYPAFHYNEALLYLHQKKYYEALTKLRKGFISNPYIAEILLGNEHPMGKPMWLSNSDCGVEVAEDYIEGVAGAAWQNESDAIEFMHWAYNCSIVLKDRGQFMELHEQLDRTRDFNLRGQILQNMSVFNGTINLESSKKISIEITNRYGDTMHAWDLDAYH